MIDYCAHKRLHKDCLECYIKKSDSLFLELIARLEILEDKMTSLEHKKSNNLHGKKDHERKINNN